MNVGERSVVSVRTSSMSESISIGHQAVIAVDLLFELRGRPRDRRVNGFMRARQLSEQILKKLPVC